MDKTRKSIQLEKGEKVEEGKELIVPQAVEESTKEGKKKDEKPDQKQPVDGGLDIKTGEVSSCH